MRAALFILAALLTTSGAAFALTIEQATALSEQTGRPILAVAGTET